MGGGWSCQAYVSVLVGGDSYKLGLWEGETLRLRVAADVLRSVFRHFHDMQPWLVLMQRLQDDHLHGYSNKKKENYFLAIF